MALPSIVCADSIPTDRLVGFNYMLPDSAKCQDIDAYNLTIKRCQWIKGRGFDGVTLSYSCKENEFKEYIFFEDKIECNIQLETMLANAP